MHGKHTYRVDPQTVADLVADARTRDLWSLRPAYHWDVTDNPTYVVTIEAGDQVRSIEDYVGTHAGMQAAVTEFEEKIDPAAQSNAWIHLGRKAVESLQAEHFDFSSQSGGELLLRSIDDEQALDDQAILQLIRMGAPWSIHYSSGEEFRRSPGPALDEALENQRDAVVDELIVRGALRTGADIDRNKLDAAFRAAIRGGRFELVQKIWSSGGIGHRLQSVSFFSPAIGYLGKASPLWTPGRTLS